MDIPLRVLPQGLYCPDGDFFVDAWRPVPLSIVTHAHSDHAYSGHQRYLATSASKEILLYRLGANLPLQTLAYNEKIKLGNCWVSLHPAGHIMGSAQVRIETPNSVVVVSGDYKRADDASCDPFQVVECDIFVTESTFALPIYKWEKSSEIASQVFDWWEANRSMGKPSVLFCYALGKAQRIMNLLSAFTDRTVFLHGAVMPCAKIYAEKGIPMLPFKAVSEMGKADFSQELIIAPPSADGTPWLKRFPSYTSAFASGWMLVRGTRRRRGVDRGFVMSDHADWNDLLTTVRETKATQVLVTHGDSFTFSRYLREEMNIKAAELKGLQWQEGEED